MNTAVKELQKLLNNNGAMLMVDGILGAKTRVAIDRIDIPEYLKIAMGEIGTKEIKGRKHNQRVLEYHSVSGGFSEDEVPWCASFVNWVMLQSGVQKTVSYPARAKSWGDFGVAIQFPRVGAIAVKTRIGGGHVGFVVAVRGNSLYLLGGNQSDEVNIRRYSVQDFITFRVPRDEQHNRYTNLIMSARIALITKEA